jgi:hypothetical protein
VLERRRGGQALRIGLCAYMYHDYHSIHHTAVIYVTYMHIELRSYSAGIRRAYTLQMYGHIYAGV